MYSQIGQPQALVNAGMTHGNDHSVSVNVIQTRSRVEYHHVAPLWVLNIHLTVEL